MKRITVWTLAAGMLGLALLVVGCDGAKAGTHRMTVTSQDNAAQAVGCQKCYDQMKVIRRMQGKAAQSSKNRVVTKHMCPDCANAEATLSTQDGKPVAKCAECAPKDTACDRCLPPES